MSFLVQFGVCLRHMVVIFFIRCHIYNFIGYARVFRIGFVDLTVRRFNKAVFVDLCIACKRVDQTDVRTFWCLDRAHSSVMGVVYVSNLESGTVTGQTARSQCGQTTFVRQLAQRVVLIHELRQLGRSEEFLNCSLYGLDVDQNLRRNLLCIMSGHTLTNNSFQSGKTDSVLVLQQFADRTDTAVAQMVDVVFVTDAVLQMHVIVNGSQNIFLGDMLRNQLVHILADCFCKRFGILRILFQNLCQYRIVYQLCHAQLLGITVYIVSQLNHHAGKHFDFSFLSLDIYIGNCAVLNQVSQFCCYLGACCCQNFTGCGIHNILSQFVAADTVAQQQLLIEFITSYFRQIISSGIEEHRVNQAFCALYAQRLTRTDFLV